MFKRWYTFYLICLIPLHGVHAGIPSPDENQAVVLMYHQFGVSKYPSTNIQLDQFENQLDYLSQNNFIVWPLTKIIQHLQDKKTFPGRVVAITVDDAYVSVYKEAYPRLREKNWPFTVFVSTDGVDKGFKSYMTWDQMREMQKHGVSFANHSATHDYLVRRKKNESLKKWKLRVKQDIQRAQTRLKTELGTAPMIFAYPYGEYNTDLSSIVADNGYAAFGQHSGPAGLSSDLLALPRFPIAEKFADPSEFKIKLNSLAFPDIRQTPWDPVLTASNNPPLLELTLGDSDARLDQLSCFVSGQGHTEIRWINRKKRMFSLQARQALPLGRSRYNCTAPSGQKGRYYWYSHLWINPATHK